ncbi:MAG: hypothetical protein J5693_04645, partial [Bacteroidales bacterium]|nr:hypothetical protein [Bacteroidales bacterium]
KSCFIVHRFNCKATRKAVKAVAIEGSGHIVRNDCFNSVSFSMHDKNMYMKSGRNIPISPFLQFIYEACNRLYWSGL